MMVRIASRRSDAASFKLRTAWMNSGFALAYVSSSKDRPELSRPPLLPNSSPRPLMAADRPSAVFFAALTAD